MTAGRGLSGDRRALREESNMETTGMFMGAVRRALPAPPAARTLGFQVLEVDPDKGRIEVAFEGTEAFTNPFGEVIRPAPVGRIVGRGRVVRRDGDRAVLEATLSDGDGHLEH
jgi:acyl-coenzyme A thioesterase PaaI-like protein